MNQANIQAPGLEYASAGGIATLTLNRPEKLNALTFEIYRQLRDTLADLAHEKSVRVVVITGKGRAFCSGGDVNDIIGPLQSMDALELLDFCRLTCDLVRQIRQLGKPVIAALNGLASGAGAAIALAADFRIAPETAKIAFLFTKVGLSGADMGSAYLLPRIVGLGRATELLMRGNFISAREALAIGLYHRVVQIEELPAETGRWATELAAGPAFGLGLTKEMLNREMTMDLNAALEAEAQAQAICMRHPNFREGYDAFREKRSPKFNRG